MFDINRSVYESFDRNGINMPYPRRDVRMVTGEK